MWIVDIKCINIFLNIFRWPTNNKLYGQFCYFFFVWITVLGSWQMNHKIICKKKKMYYKLKKDFKGLQVANINNLFQQIGQNNIL